MSNRILLSFDSSHHANVVSLVLKSILVLPFTLVPLLKLYCHGAKDVLPSPTGHLAQFSIDLYSKGGCARITTPGQLPWSRRTLNRGGAVQKSEAAKL